MSAQSSPPCSLLLWWPCAASSAHARQELHFLAIKYFTGCMNISISFLYIIWLATFFRLCNPFMIVEGCLDLNSECCQFSNPSLTNLATHTFLLGHPSLPSWLPIPPNLTTRLSQLSHPSLPTWPPFPPNLVTHPSYLSNPSHPTRPPIPQQLSHTSLPT